MAAGYDVSSVLRGADVVLVVPPYAWLDRPSLGLHLLQAVARREGLEVQVLYANLLFAAYFDEGTHNTLTRLGHGMFLAERMFARAAYGTPALGRDAGAALEPKLDELRARYARANLTLQATVPLLATVEAKIAPWLDTFVPALARYPIVGCTSSFEQNAAAIAILRRYKQLAPSALALLGGANCEAEMADGILTLTDVVDHVFSGESEATFAEFLRGGERPRVYRGQPALQLDELPTPSYRDYYDQLAAFAPTSGMHQKGLACLAYETSRGCWWGEKSHCTFCGLNGQGMVFREKSPDRVVAELSELLAAHPVADARGVSVADNATLQGRRDKPTRLVAMTDNIMPHAYFKTLLPRLAAELPEATLMYEQKANLSLAQCQALVASGITEIQPGIEALSTGLLRLMAKGTTAAQNIALLRYAKVSGLYLYWNLLYGFPGDEAEHYAETLELMPLLVHLQPPVSSCPVIIDRFSPYFDHPERYGVSNLKPVEYYGDVLPEACALAKVAYHFEGSYPTAATGDVTTRLHALLAEWRRRHYDKPGAELTVRRAGDRYELTDTRSERRELVLDEERAAMALVARPVSAANRDAYAWAVASGVVVERDRKYVPLAIADADLIAELESRYRRGGERLPLLAS